MMLNRQPHASEGMSFHSKADADDGLPLRRGFVQHWDSSDKMRYLLLNRYLPSSCRRTWLLRCIPGGVAAAAHRKVLSADAVRRQEPFRGGQWSAIGVPNRAGQTITSCVSVLSILEEREKSRRPRERSNLGGSPGRAGGLPRWVIGLVD